MTPRILQAPLPWQCFLLCWVAGLLGASWPQPSLLFLGLLLAADERLRPSAPWTSSHLRRGGARLICCLLLWLAGWGTASFLLRPPTPPEWLSGVTDLREPPRFGTVRLCGDVADVQSLPDNRLRVLLRLVRPEESAGAPVADTVAWIRFDEPSQINYPVVKSADNTDYLTKTFVANDNKLGAIFMDYRNNSDFSDRNTFIYGHHLNVGGEMFSELLQYEDESFCKEHPNFYIYTPDGKVRMYTIFSAGVVKDTADNYNITYESDEAFTEYLNICKESSNYQVDVELNAQSKIVSLSTCTNVRDDERFLVQGVLTEELGGE